MVAKFKVLSPIKLSEGRMRLELLNGLRKTGNEAKRKYEKTVATWNRKPTFTLEVSLKGSAPSVVVETDSIIYAYVDMGTRPHVIKPVRAKFLRFQSNYSAKTTPNVIGSTGGGASGNFVIRKKVNHPGTKARNFSKKIKRETKKSFKEEMQKAIIRAAKVSGHQL